MLALFTTRHVVLSVLTIRTEHQISLSTTNLGFLRDSLSFFASFALVISLIFCKRYEWPTGISVDICRVPRPVGFRTSALSAAA